MASLKKLGSEISTIFVVLSLPVALVLSNYHAGKRTGFCIHHELAFRLARSCEIIPFSFSSSMC